MVGGSVSCKRGEGSEWLWSWIAGSLGVGPYLGFPKWQYSWVQRDFTLILWIPQDLSPWLTSHC
jgi:hypothetical protein